MIEENAQSTSIRSDSDARRELVHRVITRSDTGLRGRSDIVVHSYCTTWIESYWRKLRWRKEHSCSSTMRFRDPVSSWFRSVADFVDSVTRFNSLRSVCLPMVYLIQSTRWSQMPGCWTWSGGRHHSATFIIQGAVLRELHTIAFAVELTGRYIVTPSPCYRRNAHLSSRCVRDSLCVA